MASSVESDSNGSPTTVNENSVTIDIPIPGPLKFLIYSIKNLSNTPLSPANYHVWSAQILKLFQANNFHTYLDESHPIPPPLIHSTTGVPSSNPTYNQWRMIDQNLTAALYTTISSSVLPYILNIDTTAEIWSALSRRFQATNRSRVIQLKNALHHVSMKTNSMQTYLTEIKTLVDYLAAAGSPISNEDVILYTLNGLPPPYHAFKTAIRTRQDPSQWMISTHFFAARNSISPPNYQPRYLPP